MPSMPTILGPLLSALDAPPDEIDLDEISTMISRDKSITAQCLKMANSPLFAGHKAVDSVRGAVISLGARRVRDILWTSFLLQLAPKSEWPFDPAAFWEHSFGVALVSQQLARKMSLPEPEKAYLCGLLHDIGELVNATLLPAEFRATAELAVRRNLPLFEAEMETLGFTHCDTGKMLAEYWNLSADVQNVIEFHHAPAQAPPPAALPALVNLADSLCRLRGMGYGYEETCEVDFQEAQAWSLLKKAAPRIEQFDIARFTLELDAEADAVRVLVAAAFQG